MVLSWTAPAQHLLSVSINIDKYQISNIRYQMAGVGCLGLAGVTSGWAVALVWRWELRTEN